MRAVLTLTSLALLGSAAHASGVLDETSAGNTEQTSTTPAVTWFADKVAAFWDANDHWQLRGDFTDTVEYTQTPTSTGLGEPGNIIFATLSGEYDPDDQVSVRLVGGWSPSSTTASAATVPLKIMNETEKANLALNSQAASESAALWLGYDSSNQRFLTALTFVATLNDFQMTQNVTSVELPGMTMTAAQLATYCDTQKCPRELKGALLGEPASFAQVVVEGNVSQTLWKDTDVGLDAAYYQYTRDPTTVGYFTAGALGRTANFGGGSGIAPYAWTIMPDLIHRFGQLMVMASLSYGQYVDNEGTDLTAILRVQYKLKLKSGRRFKLWLKVTGSADTDSNNDVSNSASAALGAQFSW
jgi:hypothetical protein